MQIETDQCVMLLLFKYVNFLCSGMDMMVKMANFLTS